jgi:hypothetical protein
MHKLTISVGKRKYNVTYKPVTSVAYILQVGDSKLSKPAEYMLHSEQL